jgi:hypothetical protein
LYWLSLGRGIFCRTGRWRWWRRFRLIVCCSLTRQQLREDLEIGRAARCGHSAAAASRATNGAVKADYVGPPSPPRAAAVAASRATTATANKFIILLLHEDHAPQRCNRSSLLLASHQVSSSASSATPSPGPRKIAKTADILSWHNAMSANEGARRR